MTGLSPEALAYHRIRSQLPSTVVYGEIYGTTYTKYMIN